MYKSLLEIIKKLKGNIIGIGLDDKLLSGFTGNNLVNVYTIEKDKNISTLGKSKKRKTNSGKTINIKKLYKYFKKDSVDYIICNVEEVNDYLKYFIKDSVYLNNKKIYLYGTKEIVDCDLLKKRYRRYKSNVEIKEFKDNILLIIDNSNSKSNWVLNKIYFIKDTFYNLAEFISDILIS